jgi:hypothetical protein
MSGSTPVPVRWMSIEDAASILGISIISLRRTIERHARKTADGSVEARVDGIAARKCGGRLWRVHLDSAWTRPATTSA